MALALYHEEPEIGSPRQRPNYAPQSRASMPEVATTMGGVSCFSKCPNCGGELVDDSIGHGRWSWRLESDTPLDLCLTIVASLDDRYAATGMDHVDELSVVVWSR